MFVSIVIPTHRPSQTLFTILGKFDRRDKEYIKEVIVVVDQPESNNDFGDVESVNYGYPIKVLFTGGKAGASKARNIGSQIATGQILLYLDSDIEPEPSLVYEHYSAHVKNTNTNVIGIAGITQFYADDKSILNESVLNCSLLYPFFQAKNGKPQYWSPTSNLSFRRNIINENSFDQRFPKSGGGEDIFMCLKSRTETSTILGNPSAIVKHRVWNGAWNIVLRFFRWGIADSILLKVCSQQKIGIVRLRLPTTSTFFLLLFPFAIAKAVFSGMLLWLALPLLFFLISLIGTVVWKYLRRRKTESPSFLALTGATIFLYIFDLGCVLGRLSNPITSLFKEIQLFPDDLDIYRFARLRILFFNIFVCAIMLLAMVL